MASEIWNARSRHGEIARLLGGGDHHRRGVDGKSGQCQVAVEEVVLCLVARDEGQHVASHLVELGQVGTGVAVRDLGGPLLEGHVADQVGQ